jgi:hypothetical protein
MAGLMSAILTSQKGSNESQSQRLIPLGDGRHAHARTSLEKVWARSVEIRNERGGNAALFKDHLTKVAQNSATTADIRTVAISSNGVDCSNDALSLFADLAVSFRDADDALLTLYIGQCDRLLERKRLLDASISFDSIPDVLAFRCTWYMRHTTLRDDGATKYTLGVVGGGDNDAKMYTKEALLGLARLERDPDPSNPGTYWLCKTQQQEFDRRLEAMRPTAQAAAKATAATSAKQQKRDRLAAAQSTKPDTRPYATTKQSRANRRSATRNQ